MHLGLKALYLLRRNLPALKSSFVSTQTYARYMPDKNIEK